MMLILLLHTIMHFIFQKGNPQLNAEVYPYNTSGLRDSPNVSHLPVPRDCIHCRHCIPKQQSKSIKKTKKIILTLLDHTVKD